MKPFRWNLQKREQLGGLVSGEIVSSYVGYETELAECAAKLLARSANRKLIFVGRSPENIYDYLAGVLQNTSYQNNIDLLNISNRFRDPFKIRNELPDSFSAIKAHFLELEISPEQLITSSQGICFADLVSEGGTFENIFRFLEMWSREERQDFRAIQNKLGFVGVTQRTKNSPNTWRWQQNAKWVADHKAVYIKNLSISWILWDYLGNQQNKVANTNPPETWGSSDLLLPPREERNINALKQAFHIYNLGLNQNKEFAGTLATTWEFREPWLRELVAELKGV